MNIIQFVKVFRRQIVPRVFKNAWFVQRHITVYIPDSETDKGSSMNTRLFVKVFRRQFVPRVFKNAWFVQRHTTVYIPYSETVH